jgi:hypothetical protein
MLEIDKYVNETDSLFKIYDLELKQISSDKLVIKRDSILNINSDSVDFNDEYFIENFETIRGYISKKDTLHFYRMNYINSHKSIDGNVFIKRQNISDCENVKAFFYKKELRILIYEWDCISVGVYFFKNGKLVFGERKLFSDKIEDIMIHYFRNEKCKSDHTNVKAEIWKSENSKNNKGCSSFPKVYYKRMNEN